MMLLDALSIALLGMTVVVAVLALNYGLIRLIGLLRPKEADAPVEAQAGASPDAAAPATTPAQEQPHDDEVAPAQGEYIDPRILVAISAAVRAYEEEEKTSNQS